MKRRKMIMNICKMLSLDTASYSTGYAYWENGKLVQSGTIKANGQEEERLNMMIKSIFSLFKSFHPDIVVIEETVVTTNAEVQRMLTEIVGAVRSFAILFDSEFVRLRPQVWRRYSKREGEKFVDYRRDKWKKWSQERVKELYGLDVCDDESDAILLGFARLNMFKENLL